MILSVLIFSILLILIAYGLRCLLFLVGCTLLGLLCYLPDKPDSKLRPMLTPMCWAFVAIYVLSRVWFGPLRWIDDLVVILVAIKAAKSRDGFIDSSAGPVPSPGLPSSEDVRP